MKRNIPCYLKAIVIVHGKSEKQMCDFIKSNLRLKMHIESDKKGKKAIQITCVMKILNGKKFKSINNFKNYFDDVDQSFEEPEAGDFKIFIIMDTDDCTEPQKTKFINKEMFRKHWAYDYIVPIYNSPELETVLVKSNIPFEKKGDKRKTEYIKIFPTDNKYLKKNDIIQISEFGKNLKSCKGTNMDQFILYCLNIAKEVK